LIFGQQLALIVAYEALMHRSKEDFRFQISRKKQSSRWPFPTTEVGELNWR